MSALVSVRRVRAHVHRTRRICWIIWACLALPVGHHLRVERLPKLATELALHMSRSPRRGRRWVN